MAVAAPSIISRSYPEVEFGGFTRVDGAVAFYGRVQALLRPQFRVLDIGCGRGAAGNDPVTFRRELATMRGKCSRVIGIDVDEAGRANPLLDEFRLIADLSRWPVEDASIDLACCDYVLEHVPDPESFFRECRRALKPGGILCIRTPNALGYVAIVARIIPNRWHARVVARAQENRESRDVFPTVYRCNTRSSLRRALGRHGFQACVYANEGEPDYLRFSSLAYRAGVWAHRFMPSVFKSTLLAFARRGDD